MPRAISRVARPNSSEMGGEAFFATVAMAWAKERPAFRALLSRMMVSPSWASKARVRRPWRKRRKIPLPIQITIGQGMKAKMVPKRSQNIPPITTPIPATISIHSEDLSRSPAFCRSSASLPAYEPRFTKGLRASVKLSSRSRRGLPVLTRSGWAGR